MPHGSWTPPREFDDLELIRPLGAGGMGAVHLARESRLDRLVAVKFVSTTSSDPYAIERFRLEARALARIQHPNIVAIYRFGEVDAHPYLAYEFVDGQSLDSLHRPMPWPQVLGIALGIARGLAAAHARGVLHRDLKPANVMIGPDGDVKILDFGLARIFDPSRGPGEDPTSSSPPDPGLFERVGDPAVTWNSSTDHPPPSSSRLTEVGSLVGTPLYLAPELWHGAQATPRADLYALGLITYELLLGRHPRDKLHGIELARWVQRHDLPRLGAELPSVPRPLTELIDRCVARGPEARPASAAEVRDGLELLRAVYRPLLGGEIADAADEVGRSFERVAARGLALGEAFYARWFAAAPAVRAMFAGVSATQPRMLAAALKLAVENLHDPQRLISVLEDLGHRHANKGVLDDHFTSMGAALLATLGDLDPQWSEVTRRGWTAAFNGIARVILTALHDIEAASPPDGSERLRWALPPPSPTTSWLQRPSGDLAWQELGHGPIDLVVLGEWVTDVDATWHHPLVAGFFMRLAEEHRLIMFDRRGTGGSTRQLRPTVESHVEDLRDVLDAADSDRVVLIALGDATAAAALFAATHPGRVRGLVTIGGGLGGGAPALDDTAAEIRAGWGGPVRLAALAPSLSTDAVYRHWWAGVLRTAATPSGAVDLLARAAAVSVAPVLPAIRTPTLILHRVGDRVCTPAAAARLAAAIPGARFVELPGVDHVPWAGDADAMMLVIRGFIDELPTERHSSTAAAAVLAVATSDAERRDRIRELVTAEVARHGGAPTEPTAGLVALKLFDMPARALRCARAVVARAAEDGLAVTAGLDVGPVTMGRVATGAAVARATALANAARAGQVLATAALIELVGDSVVDALEASDVAGVRCFDCSVG